MCGMGNAWKRKKKKELFIVSGRWERRWKGENGTGGGKKKMEIEAGLTSDFRRDLCLCACLRYGII